MCSVAAWKRGRRPVHRHTSIGASGGVYSTAADMARVLQYLLHIQGATVQAGPAIDVYLKPAELKSAQGLSHAGDPTGIGLAWIQLGDPDGPSTLIEKTGGGAGFRHTWR